MSTRFDMPIEQDKFSLQPYAAGNVILAEGAIALSVTLSGGVLFAS